MFATASAQFGERHTGPTPEEVKRQKELQKNLNTQRVKEIKEDTDKLLDLANELKKSVDAAADNTLSLEVIRKTDEIEKLAKKVRGKMKETYELPDSNRMPDATSR
jgi:gas vesicle protein